MSNYIGNISLHRVVRLELSEIKNSVVPEGVRYGHRKITVELDDGVEFEIDLFAKDGEDLRVLFPFPGGRLEP